MMRPKTWRDWNQTKSWEIKTVSFYYPQAIKTMHYYYYHKKVVNFFLYKQKIIKSSIPITLFFSFEKSLQYNWDPSDQNDL